MLLIVLVALAEPVALPPVAMLTWPEPVPIVEVSLPVTLMPAAETSWLLSVTDAVVSSVIELVTVDPPRRGIRATPSGRHSDDPRSRGGLNLKRP